MKKGQVTLFIIIGLVFLIAIGIVFIYLGNTNKTKAHITGIDPFNIYITECLNNAAKISAIETALNTFSTAPIPQNYLFVTLNKSLTDSLAVNRSDISYSSYGNIDLFPSLASMQEAFTNITLSQFKSCLEGLSEYKLRGYSYNISEPLVNVSFHDSIIVDADLSSIVTYQSVSYNIGTYHAIINDPYLSRFIMISKYIILQSQSPNYLELGFLANLAYTNNFNYTAFYAGDNSTIIKLMFNTTNTLGQDLVVLFAIKTT